MSQPLASVEAAALNLPSLQSYLLQQKLIQPSGVPIAAKRFSLGTSNPTFLVETATKQKFVVRRKPMGTLLKGSLALLKRARSLLAQRVACEKDSFHPLHGQAPTNSTASSW